MAVSDLFQTALGILLELGAEHSPPPEKVRELRCARPELNRLPIEELACEIVFVELARRQEENWT